MYLVCVFSVATDHAKPKAIKQMQRNKATDAMEQVCSKKATNLWHNCKKKKIPQKPQTHKTQNSCERNAANPLHKSGVHQATRGSRPEEADLWRDANLVKLNSLKSWIKLYIWLLSLALGLKSNRFM